MINPVTPAQQRPDYRPPKQPIDKAEDKRRERFADVLIKAFDRAYADKITKTD